MSRPPPPPPNVRPLVELLGLDGALALIERFGGQKLWVRSNVNNSPGETSWEVAETLGHAAAKALIQRYGGGELVVPLCKDWRTELYLHRGMPPAEVARKLGDHIATIRRRQKRAREGAPPAQLRLIV